MQLNKSKSKWKGNIKIYLTGNLYEGGNRIFIIASVKPFAGKLNYETLYCASFFCNLLSSLSG